MRTLKIRPGLPGPITTAAEESGVFEVPPERRRLPPSWVDTYERKVTFIRRRRRPFDVVSFTDCEPVEAPPEPEGLPAFPRTLRRGSKDQRPEGARHAPGVSSVQQKWLRDDSTDTERLEPLKYEAPCRGCSVCRGGHATDDGKRESRANWLPEEDERVLWPLGEKQREDVLEELRHRKVRLCYLDTATHCRQCLAGYCRCEWIGQVVAELENPTAKVASNCKRTDIKLRLARAIDNAQRVLWGLRASPDTYESKGE